MTAKAALIKELLAGKVINIKTCFNTIGITNCPREISRCVEKPFGVVVSRVQREGKSKYGQPVVWVDYRLNRSEHNLPGIQKMIEYLKQQEGSQYPKTSEQQKSKTTTSQIQTLFQ